MKAGAEIQAADGNPVRPLGEVMGVEDEEEQEKDDDEGLLQISEEVERMPAMDDEGVGENWGSTHAVPR